MAQLRQIPILSTVVTVLKRPSKRSRYYQAASADAVFRRKEQYLDTDTATTNISSADGHRTMLNPPTEKTT